jgi:rRNA maturation endonuclease Nob1
MLLLSPLYKMSPTILNNKNPFTQNMIAEQVMKRFIPNENYQEAKLNFITKIEQSHTSSFKSSYYIDYFHRSKEDIYLFEDEIREYKKKKESHKRMKAKAKVKISIGEVKEHKPNKQNKNSFRKTQQAQQAQQAQTSSSEELSPTHFLSVSKLKSSIQNIFY